MNRQRQAHAYLTWSRRFNAAVSLSTGIVHGLCLGLLSEPVLDAVDEIEYLSEGDCTDDGYNSRGLFTWEQQAVNRFFPPGGRVAVTGAGGGREVLALCRQGFDAVGYEPVARLVDRGNALLECSGVTGRIELSSREGWPGTGRFDAVLLGWGSFHHVRGRSRRQLLLRGAHASLAPGGPLIVSFYVRSGDTSYYRVVRRLARALRRLRHDNRPIELGDMLIPAFVHLFTEREVSRELDDSGFTMVGFDNFEYGTAVGAARVPAAGEERDADSGH